MNRRKQSALVLGAGGFIGSHLVKRLKSEGYDVTGVDLKNPEFSETKADSFILGDLRDREFCRSIFDHSYDEVYQLAADMGGAGFIFTGDHDADIMHNSATVNLNVLDEAYRSKTPKIFYSSSACVYPAYNQVDPDNPLCSEESAYPAEPDSEYGWEKLFSERLYLAYARDRRIAVHIARFHNIYGEEGTWEGGREKAPAAFCRKVAQAEDGDTIDMWGDGCQTRSFLYIEDCLDALRLQMKSGVEGPINIGSEEMISINDLCHLVSELAGKEIHINHIPGPQGVRGRNSDNTIIRERLGWSPQFDLRQGIERTLSWIDAKVKIRAGELESAVL